MAPPQVPLELFCLMETRFLRNAITLGLLSAIGPFAIDMYLPALPMIGGALGASAQPMLPIENSASPMYNGRLRQTMSDNGP